MIASLRTIAARRRFSMKKQLFVPLICVLAALTLAGCTSNADPMPSPGSGTNMPLNTPMTSPGMNREGTSPSATTLPDAVGDMLTGAAARIAGTDDALKASQQIRDAVSKLTEVDSAVCVAADNKAVIGVTYDSAYRGKMDDRLRGMILSRAKAVHPAIDTVYVTDDSAVANEIASLYQMLQTGSPYTTVKTNLESLTRNLEPYKK